MLFLLVCLSLLFVLPCCSYAQTTLTVVEWNVENLFDCQHDTLKNDEEFLPEGTHHWTRTRYWRKLNRVGQTIIACGERENEGQEHRSAGKGKQEREISKDGRQWVLPDLVGMCEVENDSVLRDLSKRSLLRKARYEYVMTDSPDQRGIDVALLYSPFSFRLLTSYGIRVEPLKGMKPTRDILYACGEVMSGDTLHVFVLHAPSRSGGEMETRPFRKHVAERLSEAIDSVRQTAPEARVLVMGDFNDGSGDAAMQHLYAHEMENVSKEACGQHGAKGTYRWQGDWGSLDHIVVSRSLKPYVKSCRIFDAPFLLEEDSKYGGVKPRRNYQGPRYLNGYSDHLPLVLEIAF